LSLVDQGWCADNAAMATVADADRSAAEPARQRIAANFLTLAGTGLCGLLVTIVVSAYVRRALGPAAIGQLSWAVAAVSYLTVFANPGLTLVGQRELSRAPEQTERTLALLLTLQTMLAALVYGLVITLAAFEPRGPITSLLLAIQGLTLFLAAWNTGWVLQAHERMIAPSLAVLAFNVLQLPALFLLVHSPDDLVIYAAVTLPFTLAGAGFNAWYLARKGFVHWLRMRPTLAGARGFLREAWPLALTQAAALVILNSGTLILGFSDGDEAVGQFASAYRLILVPSVITGALWTAYFPAFARSHDRPTEASALSREYIGLLAWLGLPIAALGWALGHHVVDLLFGPAFAASGRYFEWLCLTIGLNFLHFGVVATLIPWGRSGLQLKIAASVAVLNLITNALLVPFYGPWGAVAASVGAELCFVALGLLIRRRLQLFWHPILPVIGPPLICSVAVAASLTALPTWFDGQWWVELLAGAAVLGACLVAFEGRTLVRLWKPQR
jgi:PST family polysaccharide transporter